MAQKSILRSYLIDPQSLVLIDRIRYDADVSMSQVIRWAIAHYALTGPWTTVGERQRMAVLGHPGPLSVGPEPKEVG